MLLRFLILIFFINCGTYAVRFKQLDGSYVDKYEAPLGQRFIDLEAACYGRNVVYVKFKGYIATEVWCEKAIKNKKEISYTNKPIAGTGSREEGAKIQSSAR